MSLKNVVFSSILGDAMGLPYERKGSKVLSNGVLPKWSCIAGGRYYAHTEIKDRGSWSDDAQLILATFRSLKKGDSWYDAMKSVELPAFLSYEQGAGRATKVACRVLEKGRLPFLEEGYYEAGGNSTIMRVQPHAFFGSSLEEKMSMVLHNSILTHGSPVALISSMLYVYTLVLLEANPDITTEEFRSVALQDIDIWSNLKYLEDTDDGLVFLDRSPYYYGNVWGSIREDFKEFLSNDIWWSLGSIDSILGKCDALGRYKGSGVNCLKACLLVFFKYRHTGDELKVLSEVCRFIGSDTDTLGAILGGLLGTYLTFDELYKKLYDYEYLSKELDSPSSLLEGTDYKKVFSSSRLKKKEIGYFIDCNPFGEVVLEDRIELQSEGNYKVFKCKCNTELGQTLYFKEYRRS